MKWLAIILGSILVFGAAYWLYVKTRMAGRREFLTDFWFGSIGVEGIQAGIGINECNVECKKACLGPRPNLNPLATTLLLPISRLRIACHDACEKDVCGKTPRLNIDTVCGHRTDSGWSFFAFAPFTYLSCLFD